MTMVEEMTNKITIQSENVGQQNADDLLSEEPEN